MKNSKPFIKAIFIKFLNNEDTPVETKRLFNWAKKKDNAILFKALIKEHFVKNYQNNSFDVDKAYEYVLKQITEKSVKNKKLPTQNFKFLKYAAVVIFFITTLFYSLSNKYLFVNEVNSTNQDFTSIKFNSDDPVFFQSLKDTSFFTSSGTHEIFINNGVLSIKDLALLNMPSPKCVIKVPYGNKINVLLHDNSLVNLNSGSTFVFPANFKDQLKRSVSIEGEGFFDVTHISNKPFEVITPYLKTSVYGTTFNIKSFREDSKSEVVLVNGSVGVNDLKSNSKPAILLPSQKATFNRDTSEKIRLNKVNVDSHISWRNNILTFDNISMHEIILTLQRSFNVEIDNRYKLLENKSFTGKFEKLNLELILKTFQAHTPFEYSIKRNKVIIDKPISEQL